VQIFEPVPLREPIMVMAFTGWNDAGESASGVIHHLLSHHEHQLLAEIEPEEYYDYQVNRPFVKLNDEGNREIIWPTTRLYGIQTSAQDGSTSSTKNDLILVVGAEPSTRWQSFTNELLDFADDYEVSKIVLLGGLLADAPHSRPISVSVTASCLEIAEKYSLQTSTYEGMTGINGVIVDKAYRRDIDAISLWAAVPHYVSTSPSPKATLALIEQLEELLGIEFFYGDLQKRAQNWEMNVDKMAQEDSEVGEYVKELEENKDANELEEATGDSIAKELERFLRRQENN